MPRYSKILNQNITVNESDKTVTTEDGATYTRSEMQTIAKLSPDEIRGTHKVKKHFKGMIIQVQKQNMMTAPEALWLIDMNR